MIGPSGSPRVIAWVVQTAFVMVAHIGLDDQTLVGSFGSSCARQFVLGTDTGNYDETEELRKMDTSISLSLKYVARQSMLFPGVATEPEGSRAQNPAK